ncbi:MAG: hypothetical protein GKR97_07145 [Rhizobiaceae bacterium]|nr:hypothetical protein [Rhizobiaceae bacterium]
MVRLARIFGSALACASAVALSACVNQANTDNPFRSFTITEDQLETAASTGRPFVKNRLGQLQTIRPIDFHTQQFGRVRILSKFVSDGSSRPFDSDFGSNMAALLHDALYRGAPQLTFPDGYPGRWTRKQADQAYCLQLQRQNAGELTQQVNCRSVDTLGMSIVAWNFHQTSREAYWERRTGFNLQRRINRFTNAPI